MSWCIWREGEITLCLSKYILDEYFDVLRRIGLEGEDELDELMAFFRKGFNLLFTTKTPRLNIIQNDPGDNKFFECAMALEAEAIITGDKEMLKVKEFRGILILTPKEFLRVDLNKQELLEDSHRLYFFWGEDWGGKGLI